MLKTLTPPQLALWQRQQLEQTSLDALLDERRRICGCFRCGDEARGVLIDDLVIQARKLLSQLTDRITDERR